MTPDRACARCGAIRHTSAGVCPACGHDAVLAVADFPRTPVAPSKPPSRCPHCGAAFSWAEPECKECGRRVYSLCRGCGVANPVGNPFCIYCGTALTSGGSIRVPRGVRARFADIERSVSGVARNAIPEAYLAYLLSFGLLAIAAAQLAFNLGERNEVPASGVFAVLVGMFTVVWWAVRVGRAVLPRGAVDGAPAATDLTQSEARSTAVRKSVLVGVGVALLGVLLFRVVVGHDNTWDIVLWLLSIVVFGALFVPDKHWPANRWQIPDRARRAWEHTKGNWRETLPLLAIAIIFCAVTIPNLTAWRFAALGDEYLFYEHAKNALANGSSDPFSQDGVYDNNPEFNTLYKAAWMGIFGDGHFGWKMTGVVSMVLSICGVYALGGLLGGRATAVAAAGMLAASHYLFGLLHGGYNHLDALPISVWTLVAFVWGIRNKDPWPLFLAGVGVGIGFYFHYSARIVGPVMLLVALLSVHPRDYPRLWPVVVGFTLAVWPTVLLAQEEIITKMVEQTPAGYSPAVVGSVAERLISNVKLNLPAVFFNSSSHTYVGGALLDPLSGALVAVGLGLAIGTWGRLASKLCLIWLVVAFLATGLTSPYPATAITRLFPMMPPLVLLAGLAIASAYNMCAERLELASTAAKRVAGPAVLVVALVAVLCLNQYRALVGTHDDFHYTREALAVGAFRSDQCQGRLERTVFAGIHPASTLSKAVTSYSRDGVQPLSVAFSELDMENLTPAPVCVIIHDPDSGEARRVMGELQKKYPNGTFYTYTSPSMKSSVEFFHIPQT